MKKILLLSLISYIVSLCFPSLSLAATGANQFLTFQGKVVNSDGTNVTDGVYDFVFNIYDSAASTGTSQFTESWTNAALFTSTMTSAPGSGGESLTYSSNTNESSLKVGQILWNTTRGEAVTIVSVNTSTNTLGISPTRQAWNTSDTITNRIYVKDGIFRVALNSLNQNSSFAAIFSDDTRFLGINFNNDGEMKPRVRLTATPYAMNAASLGSIDASGYLRSNTSDNFTSGTLTTDAGTTLDVNGDLAIADTNIAFDGASTTFTVTGAYTLNTGGTITLGDGGDNIVINSNNWDVSSTGVITGATWNGNAIGSQYGGTGQNWSAVAQGSIPYFSGTGTMSTLAPSTAGYVLTTNGAGANPTWVDPAIVASANNYWQLNNQQLAPKNTTFDIMTGGTATTSAKFYAQGTTGNGYFAGNLGIGTIEAESKLGIAQTNPGLFGNAALITLDDNGMGYNAAIFNLLFANTDDGEMYGIYNQADVSNGVNKAVYGVFNDLTAQSSITSSANGGLYGAYNALILDAAANYYTGYGTYSTIQTANDAYEQDAFGNYSVIRTYTNDFAYHNYAKTDSSSNGGTQYAYYADMSSGTATKWGLYLNGEAKNYLSGSVGIGTTNPTALLDVNGTASVSAITNRGASPAYYNTLNGNDIRFRTSVGGDAGLTDRLTITNSGLVGIGTTAPSQKLHINGMLRLDGTRTFINGFDGGGYHWIGIGGGTEPNNLFFALLNTDGDQTADAVQISPRGNLGMHISSAGNVGIGTTSPNHKLTIAGTGTVFGVDNAAYFQAKNSAGTYETYLWPRWSDNIMYLNYGSGGFNIRNNSSVSTMFMTNTGNVGIGTTNPSAVLNIYEPDESTTLTNFTQATNNAGILITTDYTPGAYTPGLFWNTGDIATKPKGGIWLFEDSSGTDMYFGTSNNYATGITNNGLILDQSGNVGIGTTGPSAELDIQGDSTNEESVIFARNSAGTYRFALNINLGTDAGGWSLFDYGGGAWNRGITQINGNVGIGTTAPGGKMEIRSISGPTNPQLLLYNNQETDGARLTFQNTTGNYYTFFASPNSTHSSSLFNFYYNGYGNIMTLKGNGNVGIGTTNPSEELYIQGSDGTYAWVQLALKGKNNGGGLQLINDNNQTWELQSVYSSAANAPNDFIIYDRTNSRYTLIIDSSTGNVGIGTTNPQQLLHVVRGSDGPPVRFEDTNGYCEINPTSTTWTCTSDIRLKKDIESVSQTQALDIVNDLNAVMFHWNKETDSSTKHLGFIAQEVERVVPQLVTTDENGYKSVSYGSFTPLLAAAIQQLNIKLNDAGNVITNLQTQTYDLTVTQATHTNLLSDLVASIQSLFARQTVMETSLADLQTQIATLSTTLPSPTPIPSPTPTPTPNTLATEVATLSARVSYLEQRVTGQLAPTPVPIATVAGTLDIAPVETRLTDLESRLASLSATLDLSVPVDASTASLLDSVLTLHFDASGSATALATDLNLTASMIDTNALFISDYLSVLGDTVLTNATITHTLTLNSITAPDGHIDLLAGLMTLDATGNLVIINGDVAVTGNLTVLGNTHLNQAQVNQLTFFSTASDAAIASAAASLTADTTGLRLNLTATDAAFRIADSAAISASGSAKFAELAADSLRIDAETATPAATANGPLLTTTASAGTTQIPEGYSHVTINNPKITPRTLIYVTPLSSTNNRTLYVKLQTDGQVVIGFDTPNTAPVSFNWWLVEPS